MEEPYSVESNMEMTAIEESVVTNEISATHSESESIPFYTPTQATLWEERINFVVTSYSCSIESFEFKTAHCNSKSLLVY